MMGDVINLFIPFRDGATRCGPFFVVYNVLEQISVDKEVDIFTAVRQIQIRRPECVTTVVGIAIIFIFELNLVYVILKSTNLTVYI